MQILLDWYQINNSTAHRRRAHSTQNAASLFSRSRLVKETCGFSPRETRGVRGINGFGRSPLCGMSDSALLGSRAVGRVSGSEYARYAR